MRTFLFAIAVGLFSIVSASAQDVAGRDAGIALYREGNFAAAVERLEPLVNFGHADRFAAIYLAGAYVHLDREKEAVALFVRVNAGEFGRVKQDEHPYDQNVKITTKSRPQVDRGELLKTGGGKVVFAVELKSDGTLGFMLPYIATSPEMANQVRKGVETITFEPAVLAGRPITVIQVFDYQYFLF